MLSVKMLLPGSVLLAWLAEALEVSGLVGGGLSGLAGETRPWIVLETRADTVTRLRSGGKELL